VEDVADELRTVEWDTVVERAPGRLVVTVRALTADDENALLSVVKRDDLGSEESETPVSPAR